MNRGNPFERCLAFINCQLNPRLGSVRFPSDTLARMAVTISRQSGSGAMVIAQKLADLLQARSDENCPWTVFDKNLMAQVLEDHHLPARLAEFLPEDRVSGIKDMMEEFLGLHPATQTVVYQTTETILHLIELGHVIIIGRGANAITAKLEQVLHVRLVGSIPARLERLQELYGMERRQALEFLRRTDQGRARYLLKYFGKAIDDPLLYDLVLNTDRISFDDAARVISELVFSRAKALDAAASAAWARA